MLTDVAIHPASPERFRALLGDEDEDAFLELADRGNRELSGMVVWNVNSTARGGGVAELLQSLLAYARGAGVDARWVVIEGDEEFFRVTKRLHNRLHGALGDGGELDDAARAAFQRAAARNAAALTERVSPGDLVVLHDPQTAGLVDAMVARGAHVIWRCHVGQEHPNDLVRGAWEFLAPMVSPAHAYVFHRPAFAWANLDAGRCTFIRPSIDAFSPKNEELEPAVVESILMRSGLLAGSSDVPPAFLRSDGSIDLVAQAMAIDQDAPLQPGDVTVTQVSRWDALKDPLGVLQAFAADIAPRTNAHLVLAGPDVDAVSDDPEGREVLAACRAQRDAMPPEVRTRVHLATLPMDDLEVNAAMVNALQRYSTIVVQKSLAEGFGLTVAEAMWKARPVVAARTGGIEEQIEHERTGLLVDPSDLRSFADAVVRLAADPDWAQRLGATARERVLEEFLGPRHLGDYLALFERLLQIRAASER